MFRKMQRLFEELRHFKKRELAPKKKKTFS